MVWFIWYYYLTYANGRVIMMLKGNSTLKNILPKINIYDKLIYVSVIKLTMQRRYRRILTIKLLILRNVSYMEMEIVSLVVYFYIYVYLLMLTWLPKRFFICSFVRKNTHCFHFLAGNSAIIRSTSPILFDT